MLKWGGGNKRELGHFWGKIGKVTPPTNRSGRVRETRFISVSLHFLNIPKYALKIGGGEGGFGVWERS